MILPGSDPLWNDVFRYQQIPAEARQPASVDVRLGSRFIINGEEYEGDKWSIAPGEFMLAQTAETVYIPATHAGRIEGKSTWGRRGIMVHTTAGFLDPGFVGVVTLEMTNVSHSIVELKAGVYIAQISLTRMERTLEPHELYHGRYQYAPGVQGPK